MWFLVIIGVGVVSYLTGPRLQGAQQVVYEIQPPTPATWLQNPELSPPGYRIRWVEHHYPVAN